MLRTRTFAAPSMTELSIDVNRWLSSSKGKEIVHTDLITNPLQSTVTNPYNRYEYIVMYRTKD